MERSQPTIEVVRGQVDPTVARAVLEFVSSRELLAEYEARRRLHEVVCVLRADGLVAGVSSVHAADVTLIGRRRFWIYRGLLPSETAPESPALIRATFNALQAEFDGARGSPIGLCVLIDDPEERHRRPEAEWSDPRMIYAGYLRDGRQVRIAYFEGAVITLEETYA